jgi:hypothetical protein
VGGLPHGSVLYLQGSILDRANEVIRDDPGVRERFLGIASGNFGSDRDSVPGYHGLKAIPTGPHETLAEIVGVADTDAAGRVLKRLEAWTFPESHFFVMDQAKDTMRNDTAVEAPVLPGTMNYWPGRGRTSTTRLRRGTGGCGSRKGSFWKGPPES